MSTPYTVIWKRSSIEITIANQIVAAKERGEDYSAITNAMSEIDSLLKTNPQDQGESRPNLERILIVWPLSVIFEVHEEEMVVFILSVRCLPLS